jgi:hypothetical protein
MAPAMIPDEIRRFILTNIPSIPFLEALLLLHGDPDHDWDAGRLARSLYVNEHVALALLEALHAGGFADASQYPAFYRYRPASVALAELIDSLAAVYVANLVDVTNLVHARSSRKAQRFADAFLWRKDS